MPANPLTALEREEVRAAIERGDTDSGIGELLGRHRCTINTEINRNGGRGSYCAVAAQRRAATERKRPKLAKLVTDPQLAAYVAEHLKAKDSPMTISIELQRGVHGVVGSISHECIYQAIYAQGSAGLAAGSHVGLHHKRRCRKHRHNSSVAGSTHSLGEFNLITSRPAIADGRSEVGHLEGDLIVGPYNRSALVTVFDRASRYLWLAQPGNKTADATFAALVGTLNRIPEHLRRTLTWDQGSEMARHHELAETSGIKIFFAEPHAPWQRPTNENGNGLVRRYVGKSTDLNIYTTRDLQAIEYRINTIPRRSLHWATANDIYTAAVAMTD